MASVPKPPPVRAVAWRPLRTGDVTYVAALEAQIHAAPWTAGNFRDALASGYSAQVGEREGRIVAFGVMMMGPGEAQLLNLSVVPDARRQGLGRDLLRRFMAIAARFGAAHLFLEVRVGNAAAIALYEDEGFVRVARRARYYPVDAKGVREDALVMRRDIRDR
jgi:ribosomal-protein-alanine acetyltransferase